MSSEGQTEPKWGADNIGIFAYGSLLGDPGPELKNHIIHRIPHKTPWAVEFARSSAGRGGGPTLVLHRHGAHVDGEILVLDLKRGDTGFAREILRRREGTSERYIKAIPCAGLETVLYTDLPANISDADVRPEHLAELAVASVAQEPQRNGIRYLAENIKNGITTPLTEAYRLAILSKLNADDLEAAERIAKYRAGNRSRLLSWRKGFWLTVAILVGSVFFPNGFRTTGSVHVRITTHGTKEKPTKQMPVPDAELDLISEKDNSPALSATADTRGLVLLDKVTTGPPSPVSDRCACL